MEIAPGSNGSEKRAGLISRETGGHASGVQERLTSPILPPVGLAGNGRRRLPVQLGGFVPVGVEGLERGLLLARFWLSVAAPAGRHGRRRGWQARGESPQCGFRARRSRLRCRAPCGTRSGACGRAWRMICRVCRRGRGAAPRFPLGAAERGAVKRCVFGLAAGKKLLVGVVIALDHANPLRTRSPAGGRPRG